MAKERGMTTEYFLFGKYHFTPTALRKGPSRVPGSWQMFSKYSKKERKGKTWKEGRIYHLASPSHSVDGGSAGVTNRGSKKVDCPSEGDMLLWGRVDTCICMAESLPCASEPTTTLLTGHTPIQN